MALLLIRHGETDFNASRVVQFPHTPLGSNGLQQAERLGRRLTQHPLKLVVSSDYARARMTADRIASHTKVKVVESPLLRERNLGDLRGRSYESFGTLDIFAQDYEPPGGESWAVFHARVDRAWDALLTQAAELDGDLAVVTHGLVLRSLIERRLEVARHVISSDLVVANTSVTFVDPAPPWRVAVLACVTHLDECARSGAPA